MSEFFGHAAPFAKGYFFDKVRHSQLFRRFQDLFFLR